MRLPRVRFTLRRLMAFTLIAGLVLPLSINWARRGRFCGEKARFHARVERKLMSSLDRCRAEAHRYRVAAQAIREGKRHLDEPEPDLAWIVACGQWLEENERHMVRRVRYHADLKTRYFWAAYLPWVEPGPVLPEPIWDGKSSIPIDRSVTLPSRKPPLILDEAENAKLSAIAGPEATAP